MKAVRIHAYGDASVLRYEGTPMPDFVPDDVLVRVMAASVKPGRLEIPLGLPETDGFRLRKIQYNLPISGMACIFYQLRKYD